jgi:hypothetical protein
MTTSPAPRYLTKSRFKTALECPTKLFYTGKKEYANSSADDEFLRALAEGGFQVGELAKLMHPGGVEVSASGHDEAVAHTAALLQQDKVTIFEAAIRYRNLFVRIDVLKKDGSHFDLIEVKAKSFDPNDPGFFAGAKGKIRPAILPYLQDVAFQRFVLGGAWPGHTVSSFLMMADKSAQASTGQVSQRFKICRDGSRSRVEVMPGTTAAAIGASLLVAVPVSLHVEDIIAGQVDVAGVPHAFPDAVDMLAAHYERDERIAPVLGTHCGRCEFRMAMPDQRSGFHACWKAAAGFSDSDFAGGTVLDVWNLRGKDLLIRNGAFRLGQVTADDLKLSEGTEGMSRSERQWMQVSGEWPGGGDFYLDRDGLRRQVETWRYPLHFIDFETSRTALPFHQGRRPYEQVAFQFSHHVMTADGEVAHVGQFLQAEPGAFPNYAFARELRRQLNGDDGTILRWATHENSVLRDIWTQLEADPAPPADKDELQAFILSITSEGARIGARSMVDQCKMAELYYFHPQTRGSCSIKKVLPAVLASSAFVRERYSRCVYGAQGGIPSLNFKDWAWWQPGADPASPRDPYALLPGVFADMDAPLAAGLDDEEALANGGAAMVAYARLQFEKISDDERRRLEAALLKYCELDTLAMVMIFQSWQAELAKKE